MKILILYHSGAGNTKLLSEILFERLKKKFDVEISHIDKKYRNEYLQKFDLIVFGFPTHHACPSLSVAEFVKNLAVFDKPLKAFIFTTYGLYTGNSLRIFAKMLNEKNIVVLFYEKFRSPATDGVLLFSDKLRFMFGFESGISDKLDNFANKIMNMERLTENNIPPYEWYVPLNDIIKPFGIKYYEKLKKNMKIVPDKCTNCNLCVSVCERKAWKSDNPMPIFNPENCEFCLECVHKCPTEAIVFSKKMENKKHLNKQFYREMKKKIINAGKST